MSGFLCRPKSKKQKEKRFPRNESPLPWHPGHVGLASIPPSPFYLSPGKPQSSGVLCPSWTPWLILHQTPMNCKFFETFTSWDTEKLLLQIHFIARFLTSTAQHSNSNNTSHSIEREGCISTPKWYCQFILVDAVYCIRSVCIKIYFYTVHSDLFYILFVI